MEKYMHHTRSLDSDRNGEKGAIVILVAFLLVGLIGAASFPLDFGHALVTRAELQNAADAAALAGAKQLTTDKLTAAATAKAWALKNKAAGTSVVLKDADVQVGRWDDKTSAFANGAASPNAVRVIASRSNPTFLARVIGTNSVDLSATATAAIAGKSIGTRYLIDDEMFDTDEPAIKQLAGNLGKSEDYLLNARGLNKGKKFNDSNWGWEDNFLDIPAGTKLTLPTGQGTDYSNNDAALFDITAASSSFPFKTASDFANFVMYSETGGDTSKWGKDTSTIKSKLDPLTGVAPITDGTKYPAMVNPDFVHVSPVFKSDVNTAGSVGAPAVKALGLRRGLVAFKIIAVGSDPVGSVLPSITIEIVDPTKTMLTDLDPPGSAFGTASPKVVQ